MQRLTGKIWRNLHMGRVSGIFAVLDLFQCLKKKKKKIHGSFMIPEQIYFKNIIQRSSKSLGDIM